MTEITMRSARLLAVLPLLGIPPLSLADPPRAEGSMQLEGGTRVEVLSSKVPVGQRIELPEGWYRVEEEGVEDRQVGSFTVLAPGEDDAGPAEAPAARSVPSTPPASPAQLASAALARSNLCRAERSAYLRELLHASGVEVSDPDALVAGLDAQARPGMATAWFALDTDLFRNLAWSSDLRTRAEALVRCIQSERAGG